MIMLAYILNTQMLILTGPWSLYLALMGCLMRLKTKPGWPYTNNSSSFVYPECAWCCGELCFAMAFVCYNIAHWFSLLEMSVMFLTDKKYRAIATLSTSLSKALFHVVPRLGCSGCKRTMTQIGEGYRYPRCNDITEEPRLLLNHAN